MYGYIAVFSWMQYKIISSLFWAQQCCAQKSVLDSTVDRYRCEYCEGTVQPRTVKREAFKHRDGFVVILEDVTIGVCDTCGNRYY